MSYANDGKRHNAEPGTFNHECGKPATWIGTKANGFQSGFCDHCMKHGWESRGVVKWVCVEAAKKAEYANMVLAAYDRLDAEDAHERREHRDAVRLAARKRL